MMNERFCSLGKKKLEESLSTRNVCVKRLVIAILVGQCQLILLVGLFEPLDLNKSWLRNIL